MYCDGKIKDVQAGACLPLPSTNVRRSIQSDYASGATLRGFGFHQQSFPRGPPSAYGRLDKDTFQINCLPLSVSLRSKLIYTAPHDHYNWL